MKIKNIFKKSLVVTLIMGLIISTGMTKFVQAADSWTTLAPMSTVRDNFNTEVIGGKIYSMGGSQSTGEYISSVEEYEPTSNKWTTKSPMTTPRFGFQSEVIGGKIYAVGGYNKSYLSSIEEYDPLTDTWTVKAPMTNARAYFQTEVINGKIYAMGGYNGSTSTTSVEEYDPITNTWTTRAPMINSRWRFQTEVFDGKIYAIGGATGQSGYLSSVEEYDPITNTWTMKKSMASVRFDFQTEAIGGKIYAMGGWNNNTVYSSLEEYDPSTNIWTIKSSMLSPRKNFQSEVVGGKIYAIAGEIGGYKATSTVEEYDPISGKWVAKAPISVAKSSFQTEKISGKIYAIGGYNSNFVRTNSVEVYTALMEEPTLTVTPSADKVKVGQEFTTNIAIHNVKNICAEDIKITYDANLYKYVGTEAQTGLKICDEDNSIPGTVQFIVASLGKNNAATDDKVLLKLKFKAIKLGQGKVDITKGRIADNVSLEMDVAEANCGEATITVEASKDVNRNGEFSLLDLGIDAGYYGLNTPDTDTSKYDTDVITDGKIDDKDLTAITQNIINNRNAQTVIE